MQRTVWTLKSTTRAKPFQQVCKWNNHDNEQYKFTTLSLHLYSHPD